MEPYQALSNSGGAELDNSLVACRTRSKRPVRDVPLNQLEAELRAPDITTDMYDVSTPKDGEWTQWLQGPMTFHLDNEEEVDEDDDPEYNFLDDLGKPDLEDYRNDRITSGSNVVRHISISPAEKEVNEFMEELLETFQEELAANEQDEVIKPLDCEFSMAGTASEKSTGLQFAEQQLARHGWEKGKGLGRKENGISEAIKVKIKCGKGGMGHKEGEQFTFHWWDHVFNKASSSLLVETGQDGVLVKATDESSENLISNKKPRKALQAKSMLYGCFVKSATLLSGQEQPEKTLCSDDSSSSSSSEDEDHKLDLSSTTKLSDEDLLKVCGGRTAHKGARHGLKMSAKLARLEQQEQEFMNKYGKKNQPAGTSANSEDSPDVPEKTKRKKSKRKKEPSENNVMCDGNDVEGNKPPKNKDSRGASASVNDDVMTDVKPKKKGKKNRKDKALPKECFNGDCDIVVNESSTHSLEETHQESNDAGSHLPLKENIPKKEKKRKRRSEMVAVLEEVTDVLSEDSSDRHGNQPQERSSEQQQTSDNISRKKKKKKSSMDLHETVEEVSTSVMVTEAANTEVQNMDMEIEGQKRKKKKKKRTMEEQNMVEQVTLDEPVLKKKKKKTKG